MPERRARAARRREAVLPTCARAKNWLRGALLRRRDRVRARGGARSCPGVAWSGVVAAGGRGAGVGEAGKGVGSPMFTDG